MSRHALFPPVAPLLLATLVGASELRGQAPEEHHMEARFQLDLRVPEGPLLTFLPEGFALDVATSGPAMDANLRVIFVERISSHGSDSAPLSRGEGRLVYLAAPVIDPSGARAQLVLGGLTSNRDDAPGPYGNYLHATTHTFARSTIARDDRPPLESQDWIFEAPSGERFEMHVAFQGLVPNRRTSERIFYSAADPDLVRISRDEQVLDILRNVTTNPVDRIRQFDFTAGGGQFAELFDGTEEVLSWDDILWIQRVEIEP